MIDFERPWPRLPQVLAAVGFWIGAISAIIVMCAALWFAAAGAARAHVAASGQWIYPSGCCLSAATSPSGDCAPISGRFVTAKPDGYHIDLPIGAHPKLKTKGYKGIVPYSQARDSGDFDFHLCISTDGAVRYCFFKAPGAV